MSLLFGWLDGWLVGRFVGLWVAPLVRLCKNTPKGDFTCIISPAHLYATGAVKYTAFLDASTHLYKRVCLSIRPSTYKKVSTYLESRFGS